LLENAQKVINKNVMEICTFLLLLNVQQNCFVYKFFWCISFGFKNSMKICIYTVDTFLIFFYHETAQKIKNVLCKWVLELIFSPIRVCVFFLKKLNSLYPNVQYNYAAKEMHVYEKCALQHRPVPSAADVIRCCAHSLVWLTLCHLSTLHNLIGIF
jgi:hypothetical protein